MKYYLLGIAIFAVVALILFHVGVFYQMNRDQKIGLIEREVKLCDEYCAKQNKFGQSDVTGNHYGFSTTCLCGKQ